MPVIDVLDTTTGAGVSFASELQGDDAASLSKNSEALLEEFELEVECKVREMHEMTERLASRLQSNHRMELGKLPQAIRDMTMQEFCVKYGGDIDAALQPAAKRNKPNMPPPPPVPAVPPNSARKPRSIQPEAPTPAANGARTSRRTRGASETPAPAAPTPARNPRPSKCMTPAYGGRGMQTPSAHMAATPAATPAFTPRVGARPRNARRDEIVAYSEQGSPIQVETGVKATVKRGRQQPFIGLTLGNGQEIALTEESIDELDEDAKNEALVQLEKLEQLKAKLRA